MEYIHDKLISSILKKDNNRTPTKYIRKLKSGKFPNVLEYLNNRYNDSDNMAETLSRMKYQANIRPVCPICGGHVKYLRTTGEKLIYMQCCSVDCGRIIGRQKTKEVLLKKYGVTNISQIDSVKQKIRNTKQERYGDPTYTNRNKINETCLKKYGRISGFNYQKSKETCLKKYGVENGGGSKEALEKINNTVKAKYGVDYFFQSERFKNKSKQTCLEKYGVEYSLQSEEIKEKIKNTCLEKYGVEYSLQSEEIKEKIKNTCLEKYGVEIFCKSEEYLKQKDKIINKIYYSRKKNGTLNTSKPEEELYLYIKEKFPSVVRQYKDKERYPWRCDFYIPELDCFIEYNGFQSHGTHPYNPKSIDDRNIVKEWNKKYNNGEHVLYKRMIEGWTISDVKKRKTAIKNNLNFHEFWNLEEAKNFINSIFNKIII